MLALIALLAGATALSACGDEDTREEKNAYVRQLNLAQEEFAANARSISQQGATSVGQYRRTLRRFEQTIASFTSKLRSINVPGAVTAEHEQLVKALTTFGVDFKEVADALNNPTPRALSSAQANIMAATQRTNARIEAAAAAIDSKLEAS